MTKKSRKSIDAEANHEEVIAPSYFIPGRGLVEADSLEEAQEKLKGLSESEDGDDNS